METHGDGANSRSQINAHSAAEAIHAAVDRGANIISMSWTVTENDDDHLHILLDSRHHEKLAKMSTETGSSVATALAAGTAVMLLTCARMAVVAGDMNAKVLPEMQKRKNMMAAFDRLGNKLGENKFIEVWHSLDMR